MLPPAAPLLCVRNLFDNGFDNLFDNLFDNGFDNGLVPFTFARAAAILPFRRRLPLSPLILGSFAPDLEHYLRLVYTDERYGRCLSGLLQVTFRLSLAVLWLCVAESSGVFLGGSVCESNAPVTGLPPLAGFEDREDHRTLCASASRQCGSLWHKLASRQSKTGEPKPGRCHHCSKATWAVP